jgi:murein DD-endopeptidase MepM/ murein hydrolase activator NlpD
MSFYPLCLAAGARVAPLFGDQLDGEPYVFDLSSGNPQVGEFPTTDFDAQQRHVFGELDRSGRSWGVARYLEERSVVLRHFPQMVDEGRFYHAGLDIVVPEGFTLHAPLAGEVHFSGVDAGLGNYGGVVVLRHEVGGVEIFSLYGHLRLEPSMTVGSRVEPGETFAMIGAREESGGWFTHTHLQILTPAAIRDDRMLQGYVTAADLVRIEEIFPSPYPLFRY